MVRRDNKASEAEFSRRELFFEDEALAEYGYSVTMAVSPILGFHRKHQFANITNRIWV